jgi:hypothetical protein
LFVQYRLVEMGGRGETETVHMKMNYWWLDFFFTSDPIPQQEEKRREDSDSDSDSNIYYIRIKILGMPNLTICP